MIPPSSRRWLGAARGGDALELVDRAEDRRPPIPPDCPPDVHGNRSGRIEAHAYRLDSTVATPIDITIAIRGSFGLPAAKAADGGHCDHNLLVTWNDSVPMMLRHQNGGALSAIIVR